MKLSEAIRLGSMLNPQGYFGFKNGITGATCAMGAAFDAAGITIGDDIFTALRQFPLSLKSIIGPFGSVMSVACHIYELNDEHKWSRERIAAWVETIELREEKAIAYLALVPIMEIA